MYGDETKEKILRAARKLFTEHGFSGTSMGNIAKLAKVNHSLVFHHFGNKEGLWREVKQKIVEEANQQMSTLPSTDQAFEQFLRELFSRNIAFYRANPDIVRMMNWQRVEQASTMIGVTNSGDMKRWVDTFGHYQKSGDISASKNIPYVITMVLGIISSAALDPNAFVASEADQRRYVDFCIETLLPGLRK